MKKWTCGMLVMALACIVGLFFSIGTVSAAELKKISLKYSDHIPPMAGGNIFLKNDYFPKLKQQLADKGYELDITFYHAESLYKSTQQVQACEQGLLDMTVAVLPYEMDRFPLHEILDFPFMGWDQQSMLKVWSALKDSVPEFGNELTNNFYEFVRFIPTRKMIHTNLGDKVRTPADFKGKKIHTVGLSAQIAKEIGAVPIRQNPGDWYTSLDRSLFDGIIVAFDMVGILKLHEVLNTHITPYHDSWGHTPCTHIFSRRKFEKLPKEVQQVFVDNFDWASQSITTKEAGNLVGYTKGAKEKGNAMVELTAEETALWRAEAEKVHQIWVAEKEKKGMPGKKIYEDAKRFSKEFTK